MRLILPAASISLASFFCCCISTSCAPKSELTKIEGFAQGTTYHISLVLKNPAEKSAIEQEIHEEFSRLDKSISNYRTDSLIEEFNAKISTEPQEVSEEIVQLVETARKVSKASHGCYDITIKPLFDLWGFKKNSFHQPSDEELQNTLALVGMNKLETIDNNHLRKTLPNLRVDLSSIGQGYSVGRMAKIIEAHGVENYLVEIGGELKARGKKADGNPWRIAMEKPIDGIRKIEKIAVFVSGEATALNPSGTYHHYFDSNGKRFSHILDARTGKPIEHQSVSVTVFNADSTLSDAWSTALLCLGSHEGSKIADEHHIAAFYVDQNGDSFAETSTRALQNLTSVKLEAAQNDQ